MSHSHDSPLLAPPETIGFVGLGRMGAAMAHRLHEAGYRLVVYNRDREKAAPLVAAGARLARDFADFASVPCVVTMLADDRAVTSLVLDPGGLADRMAEGAVHVEASTISVALSRRLDEEHRRRGQSYVAAPVLGRPEAARAGELVVLAGGAPARRARLARLFTAYGRKTFEVSDEPARAHLAKLAANFLIANVLESLAESFALSAAGGLEPARFLDLLTGSLFDVPLYRNYGRLIAEGRHRPAGFAAPLGLKDLRLVLAAADEHGVPLPLASLLRDRFLSLVARHGPDVDWSALGTLAREDAGLPPASPQASPAASAEEWDRRFAGGEWHYGRDPSPFLVHTVRHLPPGGRILSVADGEGRHGVWLAGQGFRVVTFDASAAAVSKAHRLAEEAGVRLEIHRARLDEWPFTPAEMDGVVALYVQFAGPEERRRLFAGIWRTLRPGGVFVLRGFSHRQLGRTSGGPQDPDRLYTPELVRALFPPETEWILLEEHEEEIADGVGHRGAAMLVDAVGRKPASAA